MRILMFIVFLFLISCEEITEVEDISEKSVIALAPKNNAEVQSGEINFSWNLVDDALSYKIQIATPNFTDASQILLDSTVTTSNFIKNLNEGNYEWRVNAKNEEYETIFTTNSFIVLN